MIEKLDNKGAVVILSQHLTDNPHAHDYIFGKTDDATIAADEEQSKKRLAALVSVYVVSAPTVNSNVQEELLARLWKAVPSRFFVIRKDDFVTKEKDTSRGTVDQLAILTGAVYLYGNPALVFDARRGMAVTYSATDSTGRIMHVSSFTGLALTARDVIKNWISSTELITPVETKANTRRRVICTGGNEDILKPFLQTSGLSSAHQYSVESSKHIIHYGIACVLTKQDNLRSCSLGATAILSEDESFVPSDGKMASLSIADDSAEDVTGELGAEGDESNSFQNHVDKRVAKLSDGDYINRGTVVQMEIFLGKSHFLILYDDLDTERVAPNGLPGMLRLYEDVGEKKEAKTSETSKSMRLSKKKKKTNPKKATG